MPSEKTYPQCERCWIKENSRWEPDGVSETGELISKLIAVAVPEYLQLGNVNVCCTCGDVTVVGIYAEKEEEDVQYDVDPLDVYPDEDQT